MTTRGWSVVVAACFLAGCVGGGGDSCDDGEVGCKCFRNGTCDTGLTCASDLCVDLSAGSGGDAGTGGSGGSGTGGGGAGGSGGTAGNDDAGVDASTPQGDPCTTSTQCAPPSDPCRVAACIGQKCSTAARPDNTTLPDSTAGDCHAMACVGGEPTSVVDDSDTPAEDSDPCTAAACDNGTPTQAPASNGQPLPMSDQVAGDCTQYVCMNGNVIVAAAPSDVPPAPADPCLVSTCNGSTPGTANAPPGKTCGASRVCDGNGGCNLCNGTGSVCAGSGECCAGTFCDPTSNMCTACAVNRADCDGNSTNGCEAATNSATNCGGCGNVCEGYPDVATYTCPTGQCQIARCAGGRADADGDIDNGCEADATVGPSGPYAHCTLADASNVCGVGERCVRSSSVITIIQVSTCTDTNTTNCFCGFPCSTASDCPTPTSGSATVSCASGACVLTCDASHMCPSGMTCTGSSGLPGFGSMVCNY